MATTSLVLGVIGLLLPLFSIVAVVLGHIAAANKQRVGRNRARAGYGLGWVSILGWGLLVLAMLILDTL